MGHFKVTGDGKHDRVHISGKNGSSQHVVSKDSKYGSGKKITSSSYSSSGKEHGRTTVHGNDHVNKHVAINANTHESGKVVIQSSHYFEFIFLNIYLCFQLLIKKMKP
jgi:hypothetical protein